jgi:hypothetical protein
MDKTAEVQHKVHRVRRTKAQIEADNAKVLKPGESLHAALENRVIGVYLASPEAQAYALRIWNGQSPDLLRPDRIERVTRGLEAQGMSMDNVVLPE